jgi:hypothetical protein
MNNDSWDIYKIRLIFKSAVFDREGACCGYEYNVSDVVEVKAPVPICPWRGDPMVVGAEVEGTLESHD